MPVGQGMNGYVVCGFLTEDSIFQTFDLWQQIMILGSSRDPVLISLASQLPTTTWENQGEGIVGCCLKVVNATPTTGSSPRTAS